MFAMTPSSVRHDLVMCVPRLIHVCATILSYLYSHVRHVSFVGIPCLIREHTSAVMTDDNDDDADDGNFDDTLGEILGASFRVTPSLDLDLAFGAVDSNVDLACTHLLSPPSPPPPLLPSAPSSAAAGEPF